jgi:hypothetical protein
MGDRLPAAGENFIRSGGGRRGRAIERKANRMTPDHVKILGHTDAARVEAAEGRGHAAGHQHGEQLAPGGAAADGGLDARGVLVAEDLHVVRGHAVRLSFDGPAAASAAGAVEVSPAAGRRWRIQPDRACMAGSSLLGSAWYRLRGPAARGTSGVRLWRDWYSPGVTPQKCLKCRARWLWS